MCTTSRYGPIAGRVPLQRLQYVPLYRTCCTLRAAAILSPPAGISRLSLYLARSDMVLGSSADYRCRAPRMMPTAHTAAVVWAAVYYMHEVRCTVLQSYATRLQQPCSPCSSLPSLRTSTSSDTFVIHIRGSPWPVHLHACLSYIITHPGQVPFFPLYSCLQLTSASLVTCSVNSRDSLSQACTA